MLEDPSLIARLADTKAAGETKALQQFMTLFGTNPDRAYYGIKHVEKANNSQAIETLLVSDTLFRYEDQESIFFHSFFFLSCLFVNIYIFFLVLVTLFILINPFVFHLFFSSMLHTVFTHEILRTLDGLGKEILPTLVTVKVNLGILSVSFIE